jgi:hypothetical protein
MAERTLVGIAPNADDSLRIVTASGQARSIPLSHDRGFIYFCAHNRGCEIGAIVSLRHGHIDYSESLRDPVTHRLVWC